MTSQLTDISRQSYNSQALHKSAYQLNEKKLYKLIEDIDSETMHKIWGGLGLHISRQMRMGRGVIINKFGQFTFGPIDFNKEGLTSQKQKEKQTKRMPVFLISGEFMKGYGLKQSIYSDITQQLRPYNLITSGQIQQIGINYSEIANLLNDIDPFTCKQAISRIIQTFSSKILSSGTADLEIPGVGYLIVRNNMCAVNFYQSFIQSTQNSANLPLDERKQKGDMTLTAANLDILEYRNKFQNSTLSPEKQQQRNNENNIEIDSSASLYLRNNLGINLNTIIDNQKKNIKNGDNISMKQSEYGGEKSIQSSKSPFRSRLLRDLSSGDKIKSFKPQNTATLSQRSFYTINHSDINNNNNNTFIGQRIIQYWMRQNHLDSETGFVQFIKQGLEKVKSYLYIHLNIDQFKQCIENNFIKMTPEIMENTFKQLDVKGKGYIDYSDWQNIFTENQDIQKKHLNYMKDLILKKGLKTDDILKSMKLNRDSSPLDKQQLTQAIQLIDLSLNIKKAEKIAAYILSIHNNNNDKIKINSLIKLLETIDEEDNEHDPTWYNNILWRMKLKFTDQTLIEDLKQKFASYDEHNEGYLDLASFKICLVKSRLELNITEINRLLRYTQKDQKDRIDYFNFLEQISNIESTRVSKERIFDRNDFLFKVKQHYQSFISTNEFLKNIHKSIYLEYDKSNNNKITLYKLACYFQSKLFQDETKDYIEQFIQQMDYNKDGFIDQYDLEQFINNGKYIDQIPAVQNQIKINPIQTIKYLPVEFYDTKKIEKQQSINNLNSASTNTNNNLTYQFTTNSSLKNNENIDSQQLFIQQDPPSYPINPLSEDKINLVLRDLRKNLDSKKLTFKQVFDLLDSDKNGMISSTEFMNNIDNFIQLSQPMKDGLFAYIDKLHIGMIDLNSFLQVLEKSVISNPDSTTVTEDNWNWQNIIIKQLYSWYIKGNFLSEEEAFRVLDFSYKGYIDENDLKKFLKDVLKIKENDLTTARINRLFKIIDFYKSGRIGILDFIKFLKQQKEMQSILSFKNTSNNNDKDSSDTQSIRRSASTNNNIKNNGKIYNSSIKDNNLPKIEMLNIDWKKSVQQQLGLKISKQFNSIQSSFESISQYQPKINFEKFMKWAEKTHALSGFDLTQTLLFELFAYFDPHKKGFLTESDWISAFGHINWKKQMVEELRNLILLHFNKNSKIKESFDFFISKNDDKFTNKIEQNNIINIDGFYNGIEYLYPGRFNKNDIIDVWDNEINPTKKPGMDFNMFLGFLKKTIYNTNHSSIDYNRNKHNNSQIFSSQNSISKQNDLSEQKDFIKLRSFTPITVTGQKVTHSPSNRIKNQESKIRQIISSGSKQQQQYSPIKSAKIHRNKQGLNEISDQNMSGNVISQQTLQNNYKIITNNNNNNNISDTPPWPNQKYDLISKFSLHRTNNGILNQSQGVQSLSSRYNNNNSLMNQGDQIIQKIKRILRSSFSINLEETLRKYDESKTGILTNLQFKKALSELNLGLNNTDIFFLINLCGLDGNLEIKKLIHLLKKSDDDNIIIQREKQKLKSISNKIYHYMISPLDAFRQFNVKGDGKLTLNEFELMINKLNTLSGEPQEGLQVIKEMFQFLDRNKDNYININQWNDVLSSLQTSISQSGRIPYNQNLIDLQSPHIKQKMRSVSTIHIKNKSASSIIRVQDFVQSEKKENKQNNNRQSSTERLYASQINNFTSNNNIKQVEIHNKRDDSIDKQNGMNNNNNNARLELKEYEEIMKILGRNRKYLMDIFQSYNKINVAITYELAQSIIMKLLNNISSINISPTQINSFILFAQKDGIVDYKMLLDLYKYRLLSNNNNNNSIVQS